MGSMSELRSAFDSETFTKDGSFEIDRPIGSASISPCGRDIVLASRHGLDIIDLDSPYAPPRHLSYQTPWEVADAQWSPFAARDYWIVSTSNQKALVWNVGLANPQSSIEHTLHGHKRAITDINFSAHHPDILSTCAVDSFIHCWDLRRPFKPAMTFCDWFAGATQVKWNRQDSHILASSHDKFLKIWDDRKGAHPVKTIAAHSTKIYGVDWDRVHTENVVTCSLDQSIKSWNYKKEDGKPERTILAPFPVWRARHTPFGTGLLALPQRGSFDLHMYDWTQTPEDGSKAIESAIHHFTGHRAQVKEFLWRARGSVTAETDERDFQLVSWGNDRVLRLHELRESVLGKVGYQKGMESKRTMNFTRRGATYRSFRDAPQPEQKETEDLSFARQTVRAVGSGNRGRDGNTSGYGGEGFMSSVNTHKLPATAMNPVTWMRGVKIGKRAFSPSGPRSSETLLPPDPKGALQWDTFETLGEEITASLDRFPNVNVEQIDVQRRSITVSLPVSSSKSKPSQALSCRFDFPLAYPDSAMPIFDIQNSTFFEPDFVDPMTADVAELLRCFLDQKQHSFESVLRYLLGEQSLDDALAWLKQPRDVALPRALQDLSSSSDDEDGGLEVFDRPSTKDREGGGILPASKGAQYDVPLPNSCGARWTSTGLLVCFFPPKVEQEPSLFGQSLGMHSRHSDGSKDVFGGYGRPYRSHHQRKASSFPGTVATHDSGSDDFELSSSESSSSSADLALINHPFVPNRRWNEFGSGLLADPIQDNSQKSVIDVGQARHASTAASKNTMIISIKDLSEFQPAERELALRYRVEASQDAARHNALVAEELGFREVSADWTLCSHILERTSRLRRAQGAMSGSVAKGDSLGRSSAADSGIDLSFDLDSDFSKDEAEFLADDGDLRVERWLVADSIQRFERQGNIQMLAMLSCVLDMPKPATSSMRSSKQMQPASDRPSQITIQLSSQDKAQRAVRPAVVDAAHKFSFENPFDHKTLASRPRNPALKFPEQAFSSSASPPEIKLHDHGSLSKPLQSSSLSTSPEESRALRRTSSALNIFSIPFNRSFHFSHSAASSPPNRDFRRTMSSTEGSFDSTHSSVVPPPTQWLQKSSYESYESRPTVASSTQEATPQSQRRNPRSLKTVFKLKDQHRFRHTSLLDSDLAVRSKLWRLTYAEILTAWDMPIQRAEILKFNRTECLSPSEAFPTTTTLSTASHLSQPTGLQPSALCPKCGLHQPHTTTTTSLRPRCRCSSPRPSPTCTYCHTTISTLSSPCLACGHTMHLHCRTLLASQSSPSSNDYDDDDDDDTLLECPTGCGCICSSSRIVVEKAIPQRAHPIPRNINPSPLSSSPSFPPPPPLPPRRRSTAQYRLAPTAAQAGDAVEAEEAKKERDGEDGVVGTGERGAYVSLARTLERRHREGSFGLKATASQIWRGGNGGGAGAAGRGDGRG